MSRAACRAVARVTATLTEERLTLAAIAVFTALVWYAGFASMVQS